jgi:hypothetical protein
VIDDTVGVAAQKWDGGAVGGNNKDDHPHDDSGDHLEECSILVM